MCVYLLGLSHSSGLQKAKAQNPSSAAFPCHNLGTRWEVEQLGHQAMHIWDPGTCKKRILSLGHHAGPNKFCLVPMVLKFFFPRLLPVLEMWQFHSKIWPSDLNNWNIWGHSVSTPWAAVVQRYWVALLLTLYVCTSACWTYMPFAWKLVVLPV